MTAQNTPSIFSQRPRHTRFETSPTPKDAGKDLPIMKEKINSLIPSQAYNQEIAVCLEFTLSYAEIFYNNYYLEGLKTVKPAISFLYRLTAKHLGELDSQNPQDTLKQGTAEIIIKHLARIGEHLQTFPVNLTQPPEIEAMRTHLVACLKALIAKYNEAATKLAVDECAFRSLAMP